LITCNTLGRTHTPNVVICLARSPAHIMTTMHCGIILWVTRWMLPCAIASLLPKYYRGFGLGVGMVYQIPTGLCAHYQYQVTTAVSSNHTMHSYILISY